MIPSRSRIFLLALACASCANTKSAQTPATAPSPSPTTASTVLPAELPIPSVFRAPFTLFLRVHQENDFERKFDPIPYTHQGVVYLFKGDHFGVKLDAHGGATYEPDVSKADLEVEFTQGKIPDEPASMSLVITSRIHRAVSMNALMTVPEDEDIRETTIGTVAAGLKECESWPHPIVQLVLKDFRVES
jgi:hypothetical protein